MRVFSFNVFVGRGGTWKFGFLLKPFPVKKYDDDEDEYEDEEEDEEEEEDEDDDDDDDG